VEAEENHENHRMVGFLSEIGTGHLLVHVEKHSRLSRVISKMYVRG
jgi:predicted nuclease of restriction endonuclease-like (RecB) superfamily